MAEVDGEDRAKGMAKVPLDALKAADAARERGADAVEAEVCVEIEGGLEACCGEAIAFHEARRLPRPVRKGGKGSRKRRRDGHDLAIRVWKHGEEVLPFMKNLIVPFTNNEAERGCVCPGSGRRSRAARNRGRGVLHPADVRRDRAEAGSGHPGDARDAPRSDHLEPRPRLNPAVRRRNPRPGWRDRYDTNTKPERERSGHGKMPLAIERGAWVVTFRKSRPAGQYPRHQGRET